MVRAALRYASTKRTGTDGHRRTTKQTTQTLLFIHRFRHVNARHVQLSLGHATITTTYNHLNLLCAKGYVAKKTETNKRFLNRQSASYYLTPGGLELLKSHYPEQKFRRLRSVQADASASQRLRERYLVLSDVYADFKRHNNGQFECFSNFDLAWLDYMPQPAPDGFIRTTIPGTDVQHFFVEIYGWGRATHMQSRRLRAYVDFAESGMWHTITGLAEPHLLIVVPSEAARQAVQRQLKLLLTNSMVAHLRIFTAIAGLLDSETSTIWRPLALS